MIEFKGVTSDSKILAAIVLIGFVPAWTFYLGMRYQEAREGLRLEAEVQEASSRNVFNHLSSSQKDFSSTKLGIAFNYKNSNNPASVLVKDNKVYVYEGNKPTEGQFVEVFTKDSRESFSEAIRRTILKNYPSSDCKVELINDPSSKYQKAMITYPESDIPGEDWFVHMNLCNPKYDVTNGIRYFFYDPNYPDRFFFLSIGQYAIVTENGDPWQDTLMITKAN